VRDGLRAEAAQRIAEDQAESLRGLRAAPAEASARLGLIAQSIDDERNVNTVKIAFVATLRRSAFDVYAAGSEAKMNGLAVGDRYLELLRESVDDMRAVIDQR
jgi:hypothetical protein